MRILYDSKNEIFKSKFGTLKENESCEINIHIPKKCNTVCCKLVFEYENGMRYCVFGMRKTGGYDLYDI